jgi:plastocyanin
VAGKPTRSVVCAGLAGGLVALVAFALPLAVATGAHRACGATVKVTDHEEFVVNRYAKDAMRFAPGTVSLKSGCDLTFEFATPDQDVPHSLSLVKRSELPATNAQMESCKVCKDIKAKHVADPTVPAGPKNPIQHWIVNVGKPGLDVPGDSISIFEAKSKGAPPGHQRVIIPVSAPAGTTLYFMCGLHAWMQGKIVVT